MVALRPSLAVSVSDYVSICVEGRGGHCVILFSQMLTQVPRSYAGYDMRSLSVLVLDSMCVDTLRNLEIETRSMLKQPVCSIHSSSPKWIHSTTSKQRPSAYWLHSVRP